MPIRHNVTSKQRSAKEERKIHIQTYIINLFNLSHIQFTEIAKLLFRIASSLRFKLSTRRVCLQAGASYNWLLWTAVIILCSFFCMFLVFLFMFVYVYVTHPVNMLNTFLFSRQKQREKGHLNVGVNLNVFNYLLYLC